MLRIVCLLSLALLAVIRVEVGRAAPEPERAVRSETAADVQCIVVAMSMMHSTDAAAHGAALGAFFYYLGRIDGREPAFDLEAALLAESKRSEGQGPSADSARCGNAIQARIAQVAAMNERIKAAQEPPAAAPK